MGDPKKKGRPVARWLKVVGEMLVVLSALPLFAAGLGATGLLADVGPGENRRLAADAVRVGLPPFVIGVLCVVIARVELRRTR